MSYTAEQKFESPAASINSASTANKFVEKDVPKISPLFQPNIPQTHRLKRELQSSETMVIEAPNIIEGYDIGCDRIPIQQERLRARKGARFSMMVAGRSGLGKTTFINTLFDTSILSNVWEKGKSPFIPEMTKFVVEQEALLEGNGARLFLNVIDTPGFGDKSNNSFAWIPLINFIDEQMRSYIFQEEQPIRSAIHDKRIHCCLYFLEPTNKGVATLDLITMREISKRVNMIPIIAKADAFNFEELQTFKQELRTTINSEGIQVCRFFDANDPFYDDIFANIPFGIVSSERKTVNEAGREVRLRKYKWGTVEVENSQHSDFKKLRDILFSNYIADFVHGTEKYYESCRSFMLKTRILKARDSVINVADKLISREKEEILKCLDYENLDSNGLSNYACYEISNKQVMDSVVVDWCPEVIQKQWDSKKKFNEIVNLEDRKFQNWKKALIHKQTKFNEEIDMMHNRIEELQLECQDLEPQLIATKSHSLTGKVKNKRL